jgi:pilus assembly protein Flp/PilA
MNRLAQIAERAQRFVREEDGPTATEYGILLAMIVLVAAATIQSIGERMYNIYESVNTVMPE